MMAKRTSCLVADDDDDDYDNDDDANSVCSTVFSSV